MKNLARIAFLGATGALLPFGPLPAQASQDPQVIRIRVDPNTVTASVPDDFIGFGYETSAVAHPGLFSPANARLIQLYRTLSRHGLVRIGGNISDHTKFVARGSLAVEPQEGTTVINSRSLADLAGFLRATGWRLMWGLNLGTGSREDAAEEALAVSEAAGGQLQSFEIGNEVDLLRRFGKSYDGYYASYLAYKAAIRAVLPGAAFSGPDAARDTTWCVNFARTESSDIRLLTHHYYRTGAGSPDATLENLLRDDPSLEATLRRLQGVCAGSGISYRINEVNSFYNGGKQGVSDTFGSALWCLDFLFQLASHGCGGVNMETDINQHAWVSHYSPIFRDASDHYLARPEYYGMLAFSLAGKGELLRLAVDDPVFGVTAYATREANGHLWLTLINKGLDRGARVRVSLPGPFTAVDVLRLAAPTAQSKDNVTLGGATVADDGTWSPNSNEAVAANAGLVALDLPAASAALLRFK